MPNQEQLISILRQIMLVAGGTFVARGWLDSATLNDIVGGVLILVPAIWAIYARRAAGLVASAAALPDVRRIVATPEVADAVPSGKVVPPERG